MCTGLKNEDLYDASWPPIWASFDKLAGPIQAGDQWGGVPVFFGSDLDYMCGDVGMQGYKEANLCAECMANKSTIPFNDFSEGALWRGTMHDEAAYLAKFKQPPHPIVAHGWFSKHTYRYDLLHMWDHHGITSIALGCIFRPPCQGRFSVARAQPASASGFLERRHEGMEEYASCALSPSEAEAIQLGARK